MNKYLSLMLIWTLAVSAIPCRGGDSKGVAQEPNSEVEELLAQVRDERLRKVDPKQVWQAIDRLAEMKSAAAVDDLVHCLTMRRTFEWEHEADETIQEIHPTTTSERYPAVNALIAIGQPSLPALVKAIKLYKVGSPEVENAWYAVLMIFKYEPRNAVDYLRQAAAETPSRTEARRLRSAIAKIDPFILRPLCALLGQLN